MTSGPASGALELFVRPGCSHCEAARRHLERCGRPFEERDVTVDVDALQRLIWLTGRGAVPAIAVGRRILVGYDETALDDLLLAEPAVGEE